VFLAKNKLKELLSVALSRISGLVFNVCKDFTMLSDLHCIHIPQMFWFVLKL